MRSYIPFEEYESFYFSVSVILITIEIIENFEDMKWFFVDINLLKIHLFSINQISASP